MRRSGDEKLQFIIILFCILIVVISYIIEKNIFNPLTIFYSAFGIIVVFASLSLYGLNIVSQKTYVLIFIGLLSFLFGYLYFEFIRPVSSINTTTDSTKEKLFEPRYNTIHILYFLVIVYLFLQVISAFRLLSQGYSYTTIRANFEELTNQNSLDIILNTYFISPILIALLPISVIEFFSGDKKLLKFAIIAVLLDLFSSGGRFIVLYLMVYLLIFYLIKKKKNIISPRIKRIIFMVILLAITGIIVMSRIRIGERSLWNHIYVYIAGALPHLDYRLSEFNHTFDHTYGAFYIRGFLAPVFLITNTLGVFTYPETFNRTTEIISYLSEPVFIGTGTFNSFVTPFYYFFVDGGWLGVVVGSLIYGLLFSIFYNYLKYKENKLIIAFYLLLVQGVVMSMVRWQFVTPSYALAYIYVIFLYKRVK